MMDSRDEMPIDLSALDAAADARRWEAFVQATIARAERALAEREITPIDVIASWRTPLLAAAALVIALLVPVEMALERREARAGQVERLVGLSADWSADASLPTGSQIRRALTERVRP